MAKMGKAERGFQAGKLTLDEAEALREQEVAAENTMGAKLKRFGKTPMARKGAAGILSFLMLQKLLGLPSEIGERNIQRETLQAGRELATPENLFYQAALPRAQEEESMSRQALFSQLAGGVIGPQLARGERLIGGS